MSQNVKEQFKSASPFLHRRWDGKFHNPRIRPRRKKATKPNFKLPRPYGQEN